MRDMKSDRGEKRGFRWAELLLVIALILTLAAGAYLRLGGVNWDENQHMHPDERFLSLVQVAIAPVESASDYFNTAESSLNPANRGYSFFVYGTFPIFIIRYIGEILGQTDYHAITIVGRHVSAFFDLITVLLIYAVGSKLYQRWTGLLGALFYALAVLPIQLSHYMTVDTITNTFAVLVMYAAVWALKRSPAPDSEKTNPSDQSGDNEKIDENETNTPTGFDLAALGKIIKDLAPYILFGVALGAATASKINAIVLALILPLVEGIRYFRMEVTQRRTAILPIVRNLVVGAILSFLVFRIGQPYAFKGPGFINIGIDENWWLSLQSLRSQASGNVDFPPALQWARRSITYSWENLVAWGLGWPLGLFAWLAYLGMGWQIIKKQDWHLHLPLWAFTGLYFVWQSVSWVRSMRYQMLIYPTLALFAGWGLVRLWTTRKALRLGKIKIKSGLICTVRIVLTVIILFSTAIWAFAFSRIYTRDHTRVAASRWIYQHIPGALTLQMETSSGSFQQPLPYRAGDTFSIGAPYSMPFFAPAEGILEEITFPYMLDQLQTSDFKQVLLTIVSAEDPEIILASAQVESEFLPLENEWRGASYAFMLDLPMPVNEGDLYYLQLKLLEGESSLLINGSPTLKFMIS